MKKNGPKIGLMVQQKSIPAIKREKAAVFFILKSIPDFDGVPEIRSESDTYKKTMQPY